MIGSKMLDSKIPKLEFEEVRLPNGLEVILHPDPRVPLVHLSLHYRVGSSYEEPGRSGLAHLFEHMMFQGSENVSKNEHGRLIDEAGGRWNASTNKDRTNYYETVPANYLELVLWLEADRMRSLDVSRENFENQRSTVIEEKKQSYDNRPYGRAFLRFDELAYENWAYSHPVIGSIDDLQKLSLNDARLFHSRFYGPGNATLVLSGAFDVTNAIRLIGTYFEEMPDRTEARTPNLQELPQYAEKMESIQDDLAPLPAVSLGYHIPPLGSKEYFAFSVLSLILADGDSSRFYKRFVYENNWITGLFAGPNQYKGPQLFRIWFQIQHGIEPERILVEIDNELDRIKNAGVTDKELEKARNQLTHRFVARLSTRAQVGELLAQYATYYGDASLANTQLERFLAVDAEEIRSVTQALLRRENRTCLFVEPAAR
jgi:predicted Zn-dependent peptidase